MAAKAEEQNGESLLPEPVRIWFIKSKDNFEHREQVLCKHVWITCLSYCATEVLIFDKSCGAKWLRRWNFTQATAEDPGRQDEDDADHLEKMTDYKSYSKVCVNNPISTYREAWLWFWHMILGVDGHRPPNCKRKPAEAHIGDMWAVQVADEIFY